MSEKLCLQWNDFQENVTAAFGNLRDDKHFTDVTLVSEDGQQLETHKVILAASSPFFQKVLERNKHPHPLIYMRGLNFDDLVAIVDFLYFGEAKVYQENLESFLVIAEELHLKGLTGKKNGKVENVIDEEKPESKMTKQMPSRSNADARFTAKTQTTFQNRENKIKGETNTVASSNFSGDLEELEEMVKSLMEKSQNNYSNGQQKAYVCKVCGKEGMVHHIKNHIEANHLEGVILPCNQCEKTFRCRNSLRNHVHKDH